MDRPDQFIPHLAVNDGVAALDFYTAAFGGERGDCMMAEDGKRLMHGEVVLDGHKLFLSDEFASEEGGTVRTPQTLGGTCARITLAVDNADAVVDRAVSLGAKVLMPVQDMFWGGRYGKFIDPFGHEWGVNQQMYQPTPQEEQEGADRYRAAQKETN